MTLTADRLAVILLIGIVFLAAAVFFGVINKVVECQEEAKELHEISCEEMELAIVGLTEVQSVGYHCNTYTIPELKAVYDLKCTEKVVRK